MKHPKSTIICLFLFVSVAVRSQEFSFNMIFEDAMGNSDTLIFGYDPEATLGIDPQFGEVNIHGLPIDTAFDVRVSDELEPMIDTINVYDTFSLKKQIIRTDCDKFPTPIRVNIRCKYWPVTANWDSTLFNTDCLEGSVLTSVHPGGWWDVGSASDLWRILLTSESQVTFTSNIHDSDKQDSISVFWVAMADQRHLLTSTQSKDNENVIGIFPNPTIDEVHFKGDNIYLIKNVEVFDLLGAKKEVSYQNNILNVSHLEIGMYFIRVIMSDGSTITKNIFKE
jgi:hypothetical protein